MPRWVRSYWVEEDITFLWEVRDDGLVARSVEQIGPEFRPQAAAAFYEVMRARDIGGIQAVQAYEARYGVAPEKPVEDWDFPHEDISQSDFERAWAESREALAAFTEVYTAEEMARRAEAWARYVEGSRIRRPSGRADGRPAWWRHDC